MTESLAGDINDSAHDGLRERLLTGSGGRALERSAAASENISQVTFTVIFKPTLANHAPLASLRLMLKHALRVHGLRCIAVKSHAGPVDPR